MSDIAYALAPTVSSGRSKPLLDGRPHEPYRASVVLIRGSLWLIVAASLASADALDLVRRAQTRSDHGNNEGAIELLERALAEDPTCGPALARLISMDREGNSELRLRYLADARPIDAVVAKDCIDHFVRWGVVLEDEVCLRIERAALSPTDGEERVCGPCRLGDLPQVPEAFPPAAGPLRQEAHGSRGHRHRDGMRTAAARLDEERLDDAACWALLARALARLGDVELARRCIERAHPTTIAEQVEVAVAHLEVDTEPYAWWQANGGGLLDAMSAAGPGAEFDWQGLFPIARRLLFDRRDLAGLLHVAAVEVDTGAFRWEPCDTTLTWVDSGWHPEEVLRAAEDLPVPGAACVRALFLSRMRQEDAALALLEDTTRRWPDYAPGWMVLAVRFLRDDRCALAVDAWSHAVSLGVAAGVSSDIDAQPSFLGVVAACDRKDALLSLLRGRTNLVPQVLYWIPDALSLGDLLALARQALDASPRDAGPILVACLERADDSETLEWVIAGFDRVEEANGAALTPMLGIRNFRQAVALASVLAARPALTRAQDRLARALFARATPRTDARDLLFRVRVELEGDETFLSRPGASYLLSLLTDPYLQPEQARAWRMRAYDSGYRPPGLLRDLARCGEPVLDELARLDPATARFEEALRSRDPARLRAFLEEDEAWEAQLLDARHELRTLVGGWPEGGLPDEEDEGPVDHARRLWDLLRRDPREAEAAQERWEGSRRASPPQFEDLEDLVRAAADPEGGVGRWEGALVAAVADRGEDALRHVLDRPAGPRIADALFVRDTHLSEPHLRVLEALQSKHPLDLRWTWARTYRAVRLLPPDEVDRAFATLRAASSRSAHLLREIRQMVHERPRVDELAESYFRIRADESPRSVAVSLSSPFTMLGSVDRLTLPLARLWTRDEDLLRLALLPSYFVRPEQAAELLAKLTSSTDPAVRFRALVRTRSVDAAAWSALAEEPGWKDADRALICGYRAVALDSSGRGDDAIDALMEMWRSGIEADALGTPYRQSQWLDTRVGVEESATILKAIESRLEAPEAPISLWYFAERVASRRSHLGEDTSETLSRAFEHGVATRDSWIAWLARRPEGNALEAFRAFLEQVRSGREAYSVGYVAQSAAIALLEKGRTAEALDCVRAWVERCGPLAAEDWHGANPFPYAGDPQSRPFSPFQAFDGDFRPPHVNAAIALERLWLTSEAHVEFQLAVAEPCPELVREGCLRALAGIELDLVASDDSPESRRDNPPPPWGRLSPEREADLAARVVPSLLRVCRGDRSPNIRHEAYERLKRIYDVCPAHRRAFVEDLLARRAPLDPADGEVGRWRARLVQDDPTAREAAEGELRELGMSALPVLAALRDSDDPEVSTRAEAILEELAAP